MAFVKRIDMKRYDELTEYETISSGSGVAVKGQCRLAGISIHSLTASAGNTFSFQIQDGTASGAPLVAGPGLGLGSHLLPYVKMDTGIFLEAVADVAASASATGVQASIYYTPY